jgi:hypothetical protein
LVEAKKYQITNTRHICLAILYPCLNWMFSYRRHKYILYCCCLSIQLLNCTQTRGSIDIPVRCSPVGLPATHNRILDDDETLVINGSGFRRNFWYFSLKGVHRSATRPWICCCCVLSYYHLLSWRCLVTKCLLNQL